jgi:hypothetical protein
MKGMTKKVPKLSPAGYVLGAGMLSAARVMNRKQRK